MKRREFVKGTTAAAGILLSSCSKVYRGNRPATGVLREKEEGFVANLDKLENNTATLVYAKRGPVLLVRKDQEVYGYKSICPHTMCEVNDGIGSQPLEHGEIRCWIHDSYFDAETGNYISGPANPGSSLPKVELKIEDGRVYLTQES